MSERDGVSAMVVRSIVAAACGVALFTATFSQEVSADAPSSVHRLTAGVVPPVERITLGVHYQPADVGSVDVLDDGKRALFWLAEPHYCVPLTPGTAEYLDRRTDALGLDTAASGPTDVGAYLAYMSADGKYGEAWLIYSFDTDTPLNVACLAAVLVYAPGT